jgi:hypothetical protein
VSLAAARIGELAVPQAAPVIALLPRRIVVDFEGEPPGAGFEGSLENLPVIATHDRRKGGDLSLDGADRIYPGVEIGRPADTRPGATPEIPIGSEVDLPPDRKVVGIQVVPVAVQEDVDGGDEMSAAIAALVRPNADVEAVGMRVDIGNEEIMDADRIVPFIFRRTGACGRSEE